MRISRLWLIMVDDGQFIVEESLSWLTMVYDSEFTVEEGLL